MNLFTVPSGAPFLDCLAKGILEGDLPAGGRRRPSPLDLPEWTIYLPTRRAVRALGEAFLKISGREVLLLPRIVPISEADEDGGLLAALTGAGGLDAAIFDLPPAVDSLDRRLILARLVLQWSAALRANSDGDDAAGPLRGARSTAEALTLADDLARLVDLLETEGVDVHRLAGLVPDELAEHWQETLDFLRIVTEWWPRLLAETGQLSPAGRRNAALAAEAQRLVAQPPRGPVIVAGVTGSIPATVDVIAAVAGLTQGAVVFPTLDLSLDAGSLARVLPAAGDQVGHPEHPQFQVLKLLRRLGASRADVRILGETTPQAAARARLLSEMMRPAATTELWQGYLADTPPDQLRGAASGLSLVEAAHEAEEAEVVALVLRHALEKPGQSAALVSPDRRLARRVITRLRAFGIEVDDSAGIPLAKTPPGTFLELVLDAARRDFEAAALVALLGHPLARLGRPAREIRFAARALEIGTLRAPGIGRGLDAIDDALARARVEKNERGSAVRRLWDEDWQRAEALVRDLKTAFAPLLSVLSLSDDVALQTLVAAHEETAEALARRPLEEESEAGGSALWQGEAGEAASLLFAKFRASTQSLLDIPARDYPDVFRTLFGNENVRPRGPVHPRLAILGPFESRLQQPDVVVLGSLNEGIWPDAADPGPWLNRPMRIALGLPSPEERLGAAAHDVWSLMAAPKVVMTRSLKSDGAPTVASRWLLRLKALLGEDAGSLLAAEETWLAYARHRDTVLARKVYHPPRPRPPVAMRPRKLSVSEIEDWITNPYKIFAKKILRLEPLDPLGAAPDAALRGSAVHSALNRFAKAHAETLPGDVAGALLDLLVVQLEPYRHDPRVAAFWVPRFRRFAAWFAETEPARRVDVDRVITEVRGELILDAPAGPFRMTARADRIDAGGAGLVITDYKTGTPPSAKHVEQGKAPQLSLEAAIVAAGGFEKLEARPVTALRYIRASGGVPPGEVHDVVDTAAKVHVIADDARRELERLIARYDDPETPYAAIRRAGFNYDYDDYAHLARVAEWSSDTGDDA